MKLRTLLVASAIGALLVPTAALAHRGDPGKGRDKGAPGWARGWHDDRQTWTLGTELLLTGTGELRGHIVAPAAAAGATATPLTVTVKAIRGQVKVYGVSADTTVSCKGQGSKSTRTKRDGKVVTSCRGVGSATITGSDFWFAAKAKLMQATVPAGATGELVSRGAFFAGTTIPDDPADRDL
ncbi:MAG: hypothetical protein R3C15_24205 [Thermoleophilia bacterium]